MRKLYEWVDHRGRGILTDWKRIQKIQRWKVDQKLLMLRKADVTPGQSSLPPGLLAGPGIGGFASIYKLKIKGNVALRPMLCLGPLDRDAEWTFLAQAVERDDVLDPADAAAIAEDRRQQILADNLRRRLIPGFDDDDDDEDDQ
jgi:hypothetical protein